MKQKDVALIIAIAAVSGVISFFISHKVFTTPANRQQQVEVVDTLTNQFTTPDTKYFNNQSVDPAQQIQVGNNDNSNPFNGSTGGN